MSWQELAGIGLVGRTGALVSDMARINRYTDANSKVSRAIFSTCKKPASRSVSEAAADL